MQRNLAIYFRKEAISSIHHHHHHVVIVARISLTLSRHFSPLFIASGRSSGQHPVSSHSCWMYVRAGRPAFARPCVGVHKSTSLISSIRMFYFPSNTEFFVDIILMLSLCNFFPPVLSSIFTDVKMIAYLQRIPELIAVAVVDITSAAGWIVSIFLLISSYPNLSSRTFETVPRASATYWYHNQIHVPQPYHFSGKIPKTTPRDYWQEERTLLSWGFCRYSRSHIENFKKGKVSWNIKHSKENKKKLYLKSPGGNILQNSCYTATSHLDDHPNETNKANRTLLEE